jgi:hypothetical protein
MEIRFLLLFIILFVAFTAFRELGIVVHFFLFVVVQVGKAFWFG